MVDHQYLKEWLRENRVTLKDLGEIVGRKNLSIYTSKNRPFPMEWLIKWQEVFGWSDDQLFRYAFGRKAEQPLEIRSTMESVSKEAMKQAMAKYWR